LQNSWSVIFLPLFWNNYDFFKKNNLSDKTSIKPLLSFECSEFLLYNGWTIKFCILIVNLMKRSHGCVLSSVDQTTQNYGFGITVRLTRISHWLNLDKLVYLLYAFWFAKTSEKWGFLQGDWKFQKRAVCLIVNYWFSGMLIDLIELIESSALVTFDSFY